MEAVMIQDQASPRRGACPSITTSPSPDSGRTERTTPSDQVEDGADASDVRGIPLSCQERGQDVPRRANTRLSLTRAARRFRGLGLAVRPLIGEDSRCILRTKGPLASPWHIWGL